MMKKEFRIGEKTLEYELERKNVKNLNMRIRPDGTVHISVPHGVPQRAIDDFLRSNAARIFAALDEIEAKNSTHGLLKTYDDGETITIFGKEYPIRVVTGNKNSAALRENELLLTLRNPEDAALRKWAVEKLLKEICDEKVRYYCTKAEKAFAPYHIPAITVGFRKMKSRWGSCQPTTGKLCFNYRLVHVPEDCIEYVVCHEFTHFLHADHSKQFYDALSLFIPDWQTLRKRMKEYGAFSEDL